jgi:hypothetical protein
MKDHKLHNIKSTGFKTPDNYFETLDDAVFSKLAEENLSAQTNSSGFKVPENYFESIDSKILSTLDKKEDSKVISLFSWKKVAYISGVAASLILAFNLVFNNTNELTFDTLETASIENYLLNEDLSAYEIAPYLGMTELNSDNFIDNTMNASDIEDYLLQNSDIEQLIIE